MISKSFRCRPPFPRSIDFDECLTECALTVPLTPIGNHTNRFQSTKPFFHSSNHFISCFAGVWRQTLWPSLLWQAITTEITHGYREGETIMADSDFGTKSFKMVMVGDEKSGKTSLIQRFIANQLPGVSGLWHWHSLALAQIDWPYTRSLTTQQYSCSQLGLIELGDTQIWL